MHNNMDLIHNINNKLFQPQPDLSLSPTLDLVRQKHRMSTLWFKLTVHSSTSEYNTILMLAMRAKLTVTLHVILDWVKLKHYRRGWDNLNSRTLYQDNLEEEEKL